MGEYIDDRKLRRLIVNDGTEFRIEGTHPTNPPSYAKSFIPSKKQFRSMIESGYLRWFEKAHVYWWDRKNPDGAGIRFKAKPPNHYKDYSTARKREKEIGDGLAKPTARRKNWKLRTL